jgi:hypothetical protein
MNDGAAEPLQRYFAQCVWIWFVGERSLCRLGRLVGIEPTTS